MLDNIIAPKQKDANMKDYESMYASFSWDDINSEFSWSTTNKINIAHEAIDRHAENPVTADKNCLVYSYKERKGNITFREMRTLSNKFANVLRSLCIEKGDRVFLFLPRCPELYIALVGCAKIGAIIVPLYSDFMEEAVKERMLDGSGKLLVTSTRHRTRVPDEELPDLEHIIVIKEDEHEVTEGDVLWNDAMDKASGNFEIEWVEKDTPLFLIYTSGHEGTPIGLIHPHDSMRGYLATSRWVLDLKDTDVLWTNARPGWLMSIVYSAFAPWLCGVTSFISRRMKTAEQIYKYIEENNITVIYTIPRVYSLLKEAGKETAGSFHIHSLRHLLSALEPLYSDVIYSVMNILGLPIYDTWWTAETGMITIANFRCMPIKPGYLGKPVPGIKISILDSDGNEVPPFTMGNVAIDADWPCMAMGIWKNKLEYERYVSRKPWFMLEDTAFIDHNNYFVYQGRSDTAIITSAGRVGVAEIESTLKLHPAVSDTGVIRIPNRDNSKRIKAFISLKSTYKPTDLLKSKIISYVSNNLSPDIVPREIEFQDKLPKDSEGNILHRVLKAGELGIPVKHVY
jgi:acetyl-CoA synthetase